MSVDRKADFNLHGISALRFPFLLHSCSILLARFAEEPADFRCRNNGEEPYLIYVLCLACQGCHEGFGSDFNWGLSKLRIQDLYKRVCGEKSEMYAEPVSQGVTEACCGKRNPPFIVGEE
nr:hypothetical protein Iba_chr02bCG11500 [Ipomoea batatas]